MSFGTELPDGEAFSKFKLKRTNVGISGIGEGRSPQFVLQFSPDYDITLDTATSLDAPIG